MKSASAGRFHPWFPLVLLAATAIGHAGDFRLVRKDVLGTSSFNAGTNWNNSAAPSAGNNYSTNGFSLRTPGNSTAYVFAGDALTITPATDGDSGMIFKGAAGTLVTIPNLILAGGRALGNGNAPVTQTLAGNITLSADTTVDPGSNAVFHISANLLGGPGSLSLVNAGAATTLATLRLSGNNVGWTGKLAANLTDPVKRFVIEVAGESNLGGSPQIFTPDQLLLGGAILRPTASFTLDDSNRGIRLDTNGGTFETASGIQLSAAVPVSGPGGLVKTGSGTLSLSATADYTGPTTVTEGTLALVNTGSISASSSIHVASGAILDVTTRNDITFNLASTQSLQGAGAIAGNLVMSAASNFAYTAVSGAGISSSLLVQGDLILDGTLSVSGIDALPDGFHSFPLLRYTGALTDMGLEIGSIPSTFSGSVVIDQANKQVRLTGTKITGAWVPTATALNSRATLAWSLIAGATSYDVKRSTSPSGPFVTVNNVTSSPYTDAPLLNGSPYFYQIAAVSAGVEAGLSALVSVTPAITTGSPAMMYGDSVRLKRPFAKDPTVVRFGGRYLMYYSQKDTSNKWSAGIAESVDLVNWERVGEFLPGGTGPDRNGLAAPCGRVINGKVELFYQSYVGAPSDRICHATSTDGLNFTRDSANPIFGPSGSGVWNNGRAIDADYIEYNGRMILSCATRDTTNTIQEIVVADAPVGASYASSVWSMLTPSGPTFAPDQAGWEQKCIEGQTMCVHNNKLFMFYGGAYNNAPQQIGCASSTDGANWVRLPSLGGQPFFPDGASGTWNSSESGHPGVLIDEDGQTYLFFQGNNDAGNTWFLSVLKLGWNADVPFIKPGIARIADTKMPINSTRSLPISLIYPVPSVNSLTITAVSDNQVLLPAGGIALSGTGCGRGLSVDPAIHTAGTTIVTVTATDSGGVSDSMSFKVAVGLPSEIWRQRWFGSPYDLGDAADALDPDGDGCNNLMEFATGTIPTLPNGSACSVVKSGSFLEITYPRSLAAMEEGLLFTLEYSDTLGDDWVASEATQSMIANDGSVQIWKVSVPAGEGRRFIRLKVGRSSS